MYLFCLEIALDGFRHEQLEETAEIKRLTRARRVAISHAYSKAWKTFQVLSPAFRRSLYSPDHLCRARRAFTRLCEDPPPQTSKEDRPLPCLPASVGRPFKSSALMLCLQIDLQKCAVRSGLILADQGSIARIHRPPLQWPCLANVLRSQDLVAARNAPDARRIVVSIYHQVKPQHRARLIARSVGPAPLASAHRSGLGSDVASRAVLQFFMLQYKGRRSFTFSLPSYRAKSGVEVLGSKAWGNPQC